ncbi:MAG: SAM-dependent chlorinase/fluorinase [bacterium]
MSRPLITLTTDFGTLDPYVAQMKGVLVSLIPEARVLDLSHEIPAGDVRAGALFLDAAVPRFPAGTVHVAVIDPGVGGRRRPLAVATPRSVLVGPDNGLFGSFLDEPGARAVVLDRREHWAAEISHTFHGRDVFAPVAARLAGGLALAAVGSPCADPVRLAWPAPRASDASIEGEIIHVDHFGNLVSNIPAAAFASRQLGPGAIVASYLDRRVPGPFASYDAVPVGEALWVVGSTGRVELSVNRGRADRVLGGGVGTAVRLEFSDSRTGADVR